MKSTVSFTRPRIARNNIAAVSSFKNTFSLAPNFDKSASREEFDQYIRYRNTSKWDAMQHLQNSLVLYPYNRKALRQYAVCLHEQGHHDDAIFHYRRWRKLSGHEYAFNLKYKRHVFTREERVASVYDESVSGDFVLQPPVNLTNNRRFRRNTRLLHSKILSSLLLFFFYFSDAKAQSEDDTITIQVDLHQESSQSDNLFLDDQAAKDGPLKSGYNGVPDSEWQNQRQHPDIGHNYFGLNKLDYDGSGDANNDEVVDMQDAEAIRAGNDSYRADVARPFGVVDEADAQKIEDYVNGDAKIIGKDFYTTDKGITNQERIDYIVDKYNDVFMKKMVNTVPNSFGGLTMVYPGFNCTNYAELGQNYFQGWVDPEGFFEKYWYGEAKETIDNLGVIFGFPCVWSSFKLSGSAGR